MSKIQHLRFESRLRTSPGTLWQWITSVQGISTEMRPWFRMTTPAHIASLTDLHFTPGEPLFHSRLLLGGVLPVDYSDLTLLEITPGQGFVEQSPMGSMRLWRHVRRIVSEADGVVRLVDELSFEPWFAGTLSRWFVQAFFRHRHAVLRRNFKQA
ncbi:MAG: hypothetical protein REI12_09965 [Pedobacter sp.]|nr:hypothetical protein [Pedobacter sp.]